MTKISAEEQKMIIEANTRRREKLDSQLKAHDLKRIGELGVNFIHEDDIPEEDKHLWQKSIFGFRIFVRKDTSDNTFNMSGGRKIVF